MKIKYVFLVVNHNTTQGIAKLFHGNCSIMHSCEQGASTPIPMFGQCLLWWFFDDGILV